MADDPKDDYDAWMEPFEEEDPDDAFLDFECRMLADGQCLLAGTEECDWECPRNKQG